jgi:hypothetical protein
VATHYKFIDVPKVKNLGDLYDQTVAHQEFTFGIISNGADEKSLRKVVMSIYMQSLRKFEIVIVGGENIQLPEDDRIRHIPFDESVKPGWVTKKKNLISQLAQYDKIVFLHDYVALDEDWAAGFAIFGDDWDLAMTRVEDIKGRRFYDWITWDHPTMPRYSPLPYSDSSSTHNQFIPGAYWVAKRDVMLENPLDESLAWGQSEDVEWSLRVRHLSFRMNVYSSVKHVKKHRGYKFWKSIY